jgi:hypothetical protein
MVADQKQTRYVILFLLIAAAAGALLLFMVIITLQFVCGGLSTIDNPSIARSPYYEYIIKVRGIENFDAPGGEASLYFPVSLYNGSPVLPFSGKLERGLGDYGGRYSPYDIKVVDINPMGYHGTQYIAPVDTKYGTMLEAAINDTDNREVDFKRVPKQVVSFDRIDIRMLNPIGPVDSKATNATVEGLKTRPLDPDAGVQPVNYTRWIAVENRTGYTTYVYIDEGLRPLATNNTLEIYASFVIRIDDHPYGINEGNRNYLFMINESIPGNVTGFVPVKVQYLGVFSSLELNTLMSDFYRR